jgi:hypothetical protein
MGIGLEFFDSWGGVRAGGLWETEGMTKMEVEVGGSGEVFSEL